jgi:hypothetical protein
MCNYSWSFSSNSGEVGGDARGGWICACVKIKRVWLKSVLNKGSYMEAYEHLSVVVNSNVT